jgi:EpsD family peptidyl-prolyl cis-trans isomerase
MTVVGNESEEPMMRSGRAVLRGARRPSAVAGLARILFAAAIGLGMMLARGAAADVVADWGRVSTPINSPVTFSFAQYDVGSNFSHAYAFTLEGSAGATYQVSFSFDACRSGCGNPVLSYGIDGTSDSGPGTYLLTAGTHSFVVTGTGMGAGNSLDYWGSVTISAVSGAADMVSPVPEPETYLLLVPGLLLVAAAARRRKARERAGLAPLLLLVVLAPPLVALSGCTKSPAERPTQVVARVNGTEISALQVQRAMKALRGEATADADRQQVVDKLIDRELAVQQALARKLDQQPEVMLRLEELRRELLAGALAERIAASLPRPTAEAVRAFYAGHPELFAQRRIYRLRELVLPAPSPQLAEAKDRLARRQPQDEIVRWLARENARYSQQDVLRAAEQVPLEALGKLHRATEGETAIFEAPRAIYVYQVLGTQSAPMDFAAAKPLIVEHLARQDGERAMAAELRQLRAAGQIEKVGPAVASGPAAARSGT